MTRPAVNLCLIVALLCQPFAAYSPAGSCAAANRVGGTKDVSALLCQGCGCCVVTSATAMCGCCDQPAWSANGESDTASNESSCCGESMSHSSDHLAIDAVRPSKPKRIEAQVSPQRIADIVPLTDGQPQCSNCLCGHQPAPMNHSPANRSTLEIRVATDAISGDDIGHLSIALTLAVRSVDSFPAYSSRSLQRRLCIWRL